MTNRFTDCYSEKQSGPIGGYWKYPLVSLKDALASVLSKINGLDRDIKEAYDHCHFPSEHGLTKDEAAALFLYTLEAVEIDNNDPAETPATAAAASLASSSSSSASAAAASYVQPKPLTKTVPNVPKPSPPKPSPVVPKPGPSVSIKP
ncbi:unnamed protein product [Rotaria sordida]|uniref:Uncharacterized protein n=1 Tax=Rotaria sordida TaxID=392033 RepID=A0A819QU11_9BILA|nr:unnamed protein product [Rotaria sordida]